MLRAGLTVEHPIFSCTDSGPVEDSLRFLFAASRRQESRDVMLLSALYRFLGALIEGADSEPGAAAAVLSKDRYVQKALEYIETNYSHSMSVESMADQIGLSRKYLARRFKEATGRTPQDFLVQYRISKAADLLSEPSLSVSEIAYSVGYRDPLLFSRMFKRLRGVSPCITAGDCPVRSRRVYKPLFDFHCRLFI
ncbi:AraC family transcriptional regulator [Paenibacillus sp. P26]|nr:AraC family transcriptional regulator [Paenibacillus sp. P26]